MARTAVFAVLALVGFAANSLLCRTALRNGAIDPATFSAIRLASGAIALTALALARGGGTRPRSSSWGSAGLLFLYAAPFSFAYVSLGTGTGALLLFGAVQVTMLLAAVRRGERPGALRWLGLAIAFAGLIGLVFPGITAPAPAGAALMVVAGIAWGLYSLRGRGATDPLGTTAGNFLRTVPMAAALWLVARPSAPIQTVGVVWAALSGAVASGVGYALWYGALRDLSAVTAAAVQLVVPVLAACGGIVLLGEAPTPRLAIASLLVLGGIALTIRRAPPRAA